MVDLGGFPEVRAEAEVDVGSRLGLVVVLESSQLVLVLVDHAASAQSKVVHNLHTTQQAKPQEQARYPSK